LPVRANQSRSEFVNFVYSPRGKPRLDPGGPSVLHFNLAHAEDLAIFALTRIGEVGVDLECVRRIEDADDLVARFFSKGENATFQALPEAARAVAFFNLWTRKEALLKATGEGLGAALNGVEVSFLPGETARLVAIAGDTRCASEWNLEEFSPAAGYVGAAAVRSQKMRLRCWKWNLEGV
jgi:4'-phosphopantetheinyl transferase